jgi:hypothetical protein
MKKPTQVAQQGRLFWWREDGRSGLFLAAAGPADDGCTKGREGMRGWRREGGVGEEAGRVAASLPGGACCGGRAGGGGEEDGDDVPLSMPMDLLVVMVVVYCVSVQSAWHRLDSATTLQPPCSASVSACTPTPLTQPYTLPRHTQEDLRRRLLLLLLLLAAASAPLSFC